MPDRSEDIARAKVLVEEKEYTIRRAAEEVNITYTYLTTIARKNNWNRPAKKRSIIGEFPWGKGGFSLNEFTEEQLVHLINKAQATRCETIKEYMMETLKDALEEEMAKEAS